MKKLITALTLSVLTPALFAFTLPDLKDKGADVAEKISAHKPAGDSFKYNYTPMVFELETDYQRSLYTVLYIDEETGREERTNMNYKQDGLFGPGAGEFTANCYATLLNKDYILTHKSCIYLDTVDYEGDDLPADSYAEFERRGMTFKLNGRSLYINKDTKINASIDSRSGAALIKISDLCFQTKPTTASNVCVQLWEYVWNYDNEYFDIKNNYGTYILSNINPEDKVGDSFTKRAFFSPVSGTKTIKEFKKGYVTVDGKVEKSYMGEPLFHKPSSDKNILVGIKTASDKYVINKTKTNNYALFSSSFTEVFKENVKSKGIKLVKDLNAERSL